MEVSAWRTRGGLLTVAALSLCACDSSSDSKTPPPPEPPGTIDLTIADGAIVEGDEATGNLAFELSLSSAPSQVLGVDFETRAGSASGGLDFQSASGRIEFAAGETAKTLEVEILGDLLDEPDESFTVMLSNPDSGLALADGEATGTIEDDDPAPVMTIADASAPEGDEQSSVSLAVTLDAPSSFLVSARYQTEDGSAQAGEDYVAGSGAIEFVPGAVSASVVLTISGDTAEESDETFTVRLSNPDHAVIVSDTATVTLLNDDAAPEPGFGISERPANPDCVAPQPPEVPDLLSATGCIDDSDPTDMAKGVVPYEMNAGFWSDGSDKDRFMALPDGTGVTIGTDHDWTFPVGSVLIKRFYLAGRLIETRHMVRHPDGAWAGYTWEWDAAQAEAIRVVGGKTVTIDGQEWLYPSEAQCMECHSTAAGFVLGPETGQLNGDFLYPESGVTDNQLETLDHIAWFDAPLPDVVENLPVLPHPFDPMHELGERARTYLHVNCSQCHRPGGPTPSNMDWRYGTDLADTNACGVPPSHGFLGGPGSLIVDPGDPANSVLLRRASRRDAMGMPPLASFLVDTAGVAVLTDWITQLQGCD